MAYCIVSQHYKKYNSNLYEKILLGGIQYAKLTEINSEIAKKEIAPTRLQKYVDFTKLKEKQCQKKVLLVKHS